MDNPNQKYRICLEVFAKISAEISHDLKNTIAIIKENAGLLHDYDMMNGGNGASSEQINKGTSAIEKQVERSNVIIEKMNRFAHSADHEFGSESLYGLISICIDLSNRKAAGKSLQISLSCPEEDIEIKGQITVLESLIYLVLMEAYRLCQRETQLKVVSRKLANNVEISFIYTSASEEHLDADVSEKINVLCHSTGASVSQSAGTIILVLPL